MFLLTIDADSSCQNKIKSSNRDLNFNYLKDFRIDIKFTCFLRFDEQVKLDLIEAHEIGWHPHFLMKNLIIIATCLNSMTK